MPCPPAYSDPEAGFPLAMVVHDWECRSKQTRVATGVVVFDESLDAPDSVSRRTSIPKVATGCAECDSIVGGRCLIRQNLGGGLFGGADAALMSRREPGLVWSAGQLQSWDSCPVSRSLTICEPRVSGANVVNDLEFTAYVDDGLWYPSVGASSSKHSDGSEQEAKILWVDDLFGTHVRAQSSIGIETLRNGAGCVIAMTTEWLIDSAWNSGTFLYEILWRGAITVLAEYEECGERASGKAARILDRLPPGAVPESMKQGANFNCLGCGG